MKVPKRRNTVPSPFGVFTQERKHGPYRTAVKTFGLPRYSALTYRQKTLSSASNTSVFRNVGATHPATQSHIPEDLNLQQHHSENFRSLMMKMMMLMTAIIIIIIICEEIGVKRTKNTGMTMYQNRWKQVMEVRQPYDGIN
jgi:hypothetical protein